MNINNYKAYDIEPEDNKNRIVTQDYLTLDLDYKKGRCIIGNPPFGDRMNLATKFIKKSYNICDYIVFILPISQYKNNYKFYEFDLIHSEDLGEHIYTDRKIKCCLNIYKRSINGLLNKRKEYKFHDIELYEQIKKQKPKKK